MKKRESTELNLQKIPVDAQIIEHLAVMEIYRHIYQAPYKMLGEIAMADKGISYDGFIHIFNSPSFKKINKNLDKATGKIQKELNKIGEVRIQIKGTQHTNRNFPNKLNYSVSYGDFSIYNDNDQGILYFVVLCNLATNKNQAYFLVLTPMEVKKYTQLMEKEDKNSHTLKFRKLDDGDLHDICRRQTKAVKEYSTRAMRNINMEVFNYKDSMIKMEVPHAYKNSMGQYEVDPLDANFHLSVYVKDLNSYIPFALAKLSEQGKTFTQKVELFNENLNISCLIREEYRKKSKRSDERIMVNTLIIENILEFSEENSNEKTYFKRFYSVESYLKALKVYKYIVTYHKLPFTEHKLPFVKIETFKDEKELLRKIDLQISKFEEIKKVFMKLGIPLQYVFKDENEDIQNIMNFAYEILYKNNYKAAPNMSFLGRSPVKDLTEDPILNLQLTNDLSVISYKIYNENLKKDEFLSLFTETIAETGVAFSNTIKDPLPISVYFLVNIYDAQKAINFDFELYRKGLLKYNNYVQSTNVFALHLVNSFLISDNQTQARDFKFLLLAYELLEEVVKAKDYNKEVNGDLLHINKIIIKQIISDIPNLRECIEQNRIYYDSLKYKIEGQTEKDEEYLENILEGEYIIPNNSSLPLEMYKYASAIILGYKPKITKIEKSLDKEWKNFIDGLPLDYLYQKIFNGKWEAITIYAIE